MFASIQNYEITPKSKLRSQIFSIYDDDAHPTKVASESMLTMNRGLQKYENYDNKILFRTVFGFITNNNMKTWFVANGLLNPKFSQTQIEQECQAHVIFLRTKKIKIFKQKNETYRTALINHIFQTAWNKATSAQQYKIVQQCEEISPSLFSKEYSSMQKLRFRIVDATGDILSNSVIKFSLGCLAVLAVIATMVAAGAFLEDMTTRYLIPYFINHCPIDVIGAGNKLLDLYQSFRFVHLLGIGIICCLAHQINRATFDNERFNTFILSSFILILNILSLPKIIEEKIKKIHIYILTHIYNTTITTNDRISLQCKHIAGAQRRAYLKYGTPIAFQVWQQLDQEKFFSQPTK